MKVLICGGDRDTNKYISECVENYNDFEAESETENTRCIERIDKEHIDMAIISLKGMDYEEIINRIKDRKLGTVLYLVGDNKEDSVNVYEYKCDGYINKKNIKEDMENCMENFMLLSKRIHRLKIVTFGRFDFFADGERVELSNKKAKELLALCIDKCGGRVSLEEATDKLWYGRPYDKRVKCLYRKAVMELNAFFREKGMGGVFFKGRGYCCINKDAFDCDYYKFLENPKRGKMLYNGEYMFEYSWAEETLARLENLYLNF